MILKDLVAASQRRLMKDMQKDSLEHMMERAEACYKKDSAAAFSFENSMKGPEIQFICEVKKASPSKGIIAPEFPYVDIGKAYEKAGAAAISVLTETDYFLGSDRYLKEIHENVSLPLLRKDFTIDAYQIYQAKALGAAAILLICAVLDEETISKYIKICDSLGMSALVEAHDEEEIRQACRAGARIIGVNNRNLKDFTVDIGNSLRLRKRVPKDIVFIAESGISTSEDVKALREGGVDGVLIGESLMRAKDKKKMLDNLRGGRIDSN